jgi:hypothetical protein
LTLMGLFELETCAHCGREFPKDPSSPTNLSCAGCRQSHQAAAEDRARSLKARVDELERIVTAEKAPDRELARLHGVVIGKGSEGTTVLVQFSPSDLVAEFPIELSGDLSLCADLSLYGQPVDCVVRVRADGLCYLHYELVRPAGVNPVLPELERLLSGIG